jgi:hypothetical protein
MRVLAFLTGLFVIMAPALAQTVPVPVFFHLPSENWRTKPVADSIRSALAHAPNLKLASSAVPGALVISIPDGLKETGHESNTSYSFTVVFSRDGAKIGESVEECKSSALQECVDQIVADAESAASLR